MPPMLKFQGHFSYQDNESLFKGPSSTKIQVKAQIFLPNRLVISQLNSDCPPIVISIDSIIHIELYRNSRIKDYISFLIYLRNDTFQLQTMDEAQLHVAMQNIWNLMPERLQSPRLQTMALRKRRNPLAPNPWLKELFIIESFRIRSFSDTDAACFSKEIPFTAIRSCAFHQKIYGVTNVLTITTRGERQTHISHPDGSIIQGIMDFLSDFGFKIAK